MIYGFRLTIYESVVAVTALRKSEIKNRKQKIVYGKYTTWPRATPAI